MVCLTKCRNDFRPSIGLIRSITALATNSGDKFEVFCCSFIRFLQLLDRNSRQNRIALYYSFTRAQKQFKRFNRSLTVRKQRQIDQPRL